MDFDGLVGLFLTVVFVLGLFAAIIPVSSPRKLPQDWVMFWGGLLAAGGEGAFGLAMYDSYFVQDEELIFAMLGLMGFGMLLFAMGFLYDQLQSRRVVKTREQLSHFEKGGPSDD